MGFGGDPVGESGEFSFWCEQAGTGSVHTAGVENVSCAASECLDAVVMTGDVWTGDTSVGTDEVDPGCGSMGLGDGPDQTMYWEPETDGCYMFTVVGDAGSTIVPNLSFASECGASSMECVFATSSAEYEVPLSMEFGAIAGESLYLNVDSWFGHGGPYTASIESVDVASSFAADAVWSPDEAEGNVMSISFDEATPYADVHTSSCDYDPEDALGDAVIEWTAPHDGCFRMDTFGTSGDTVLSVIEDGDCGDVESICNNNSSGLLASRVEYEALGGATVRVVLGNYAGEGVVELRIQECL
jgi:hypothetical protein